MSALHWYQRGSSREHLMIWHTDYNKAHRCPRSMTDECSGYVDGNEAGERYFTTWHVHTCKECGLRVARNLFLPSYPKAGDGYRNRLRLLIRNMGFWWTGFSYPGRPEFVRKWKRRLRIR